VFIDRDVEVEMSSIPATEGWQGLVMEECSHKLIAAIFMFVHKSINVKVEASVRERPECYDAPILGNRQYLALDSRTLRMFLD
jgi:hypothetical protein